MTIDENKLNEFMGKMVGDLGATMSSALAGPRRPARPVQGDGGCRARHAGRAGQAHRDRRALRRRMAECAGRLGLRGLRRRRQAATRLPPEQAFALADDDSPASVAGAFSVARAMWSALDEMEANFRTGGGLEWGHQHPCLFEGTERFFRAGLHRQPGRLVDPRARRRQGEARGRRQGCRRGCGLRRLDDLDGQGIPEVDLPRLRLSPGVDRHRDPRARRRRAWRTA